MKTSSIQKIYEIICEVIDSSFLEENYSFDFHEYLKQNKIKKDVIQQFLNSSVVTSIQYQIEELVIYTEKKEQYSVVQESYSWMGELRATRLKNYLQKLLDDAHLYERTRRGGRKKTKVLQSSNK